MEHEKLGCAIRCYWATRPIDLYLFSHAAIPRCSVAESMARTLCSIPPMAILNVQFGAREPPQ